MYVAVVISAASLLAWTWLLLARGRFWQCTQELKDIHPEPDTWPDVVAVIPARNEADFIGRCLASLAAQEYPGALSVVVVDDGSDDGTAAVARTAGEGLTREVVSGSDLPAGWTGKLWALDQGISRARQSAPDAIYLWLTDADIEHDPGVLRLLVATAEARRLDMVSTMVLLNCRSFWERLLIPAFVFFFQKLYPFPLVNDPRATTAAAAGGCVLLRRSALARIGGLESIRGELIDDCALARAVKRGGPIWLGLTRRSRSLRRYGTLREIWSMVARTAFHQLRYSRLLLVGTVVAMGIIYLAPVLTLAAWPLHGNTAAVVFAVLAFAAMMTAFAPTARLYRVGVMGSLGLPLAAALYTGMTVDSALRHWRGRGGTWKARHHLPQA